jgi:hypothetical protein
LVHEKEEEKNDEEKEAAVEKAAAATLEELAKSPKFWKMAAADRVAFVRQSWYTLLTSVLITFSSSSSVSLLGSSKICSSTFNRLDDMQDPIVLGAIWDASLATVAKWKEWHEATNLEKSVVPKMQTLLRRKNVPADIYPKVLPLLARFPLDSQTKFGSVIVISLREGFGVDSTNDASSSSSRRGAAVSEAESRPAVEAYFECAAFVAKVGDKAVVDDVLNLMESAFASENSDIVFFAFSDVFLAAVANANDDGNLMETVWDRLSAQVRHVHDERPECKGNLLRFIQCLNGKRRKKKQRKGIRFEHEEEEEKEMEVESSSTPKMVGRRMAELSTTLAAAALNKTEFPDVGFAVGLIEAASTSEDFYRLLNQRLQLKEGEGKSAAFVFLENRVLGGDRLNGSAKDEIARLSVAVYASLGSKSEKSKFFTLANAAGDADDVLCSALASGLCKRRHLDPEVKVWLASDELGSKLTASVKATLLCAGGAKEDFVRTVIRNSDFVSESNLGHLFCALSSALNPSSDDGSGSFDRVVSFTCEVIDAIAMRNKLTWKVKAAGDVLVKLVSLDCKFGTERDSWLLNPTTREKLR